MMVGKSNISDEQVIEAVNKYMETHPDATRSKVITKAVAVSEKRLRDMEAAGLIKLPKPLGKSARTHIWRQSIHRNIREKTA
jgi:hypothetical protein